MAKRRANSEGTVVQRGDGRWMAQLTLPGGQRRSFYGKTQAEVISKLREARQRLDEGLPPTPEKLTVGQWLETWLRDSVAHAVRPRTAVRYGEIVRCHLAPRLGHVRLAHLQPADVERAMREALEAGQSPRSVLHHRAVLRAALNHAIRHGLIARNAAALAAAPHVPEGEHEAITPARAKAILQAVQGDSLEALFLLLLSTGMREGEALGLQWADVNLDAGTASIRRVLQRVNGEWAFREPKTRRSRRTVSLPAPVVAALREHRARQLEERLRLGPDWQGEQWGNLVFPNETGGPLHGNTALHRFQRLLQRAGLPRMRVHDLRHGAASLMAAMGIPPRVAMELLGHSQISTTMNIYAHVAPEYSREAMERVSKALWG